MFWSADQLKIKMTRRSEVKLLIKASLSLVLTLALMLPASFVVLAEEITCRGSMGAVTVDNLRVPKKASCKLYGTKVKGTIKVENGASLIARKVSVIGNIQAEGAKSVKVLGSRVGGSIQIKQGGAARIINVRINGDILFDSNNRLLLATSNKVGGNIQAFQNTGGVTISFNTIDGNLQCKENIPKPTGRRNVVHGSKEDQCKRL
jgi:hypothetical protein